MFGVRLRMMSSECVSRLKYAADSDAEQSRKSRIVGLHCIVQLMSLILRCLGLSCAPDLLYLFNLSDSQFLVKL